MKNQRPLFRAYRFAAHALPQVVMTIAILLLTAHCSLLTVLGQSATAILSGTVEDQNGAVVPGVSITVQNRSTSFERQVETNDSGSFTFPLLPPGTYAVTARRDGFTPVEVQNVVLNVGDQKALQIQLKAGDINAEVQVISEAPLINESPAVATVVDRQFVGRLPLNGRSFQSLILLTPGVVVASVSNDQPGQFSVNGQRATANYFTVDGVSANIGVSANTATQNVTQNAAGTLPGLSAFGSTNTLVSIDALEEFKIQTSTYAAEFGRQPGGQVQLVTRSGGNQFHGTAFYYLRNEAFDANDWFANRAGRKRAPLRQHQFGGTFSGPIMLPRFGEGGKAYWSGRDTTFFFFSHESLRLRLPINFNKLVPSLRLRQLAPAAMQPLLNMMPQPTGPETTDSTGSPSGAAPFVGSGSSPSTMDATSFRIDRRLGSKLSLFGRYNEAPSSKLTRDLSSLRGLKATTRTLTLGATLSLNQLSNELRFNYSSNRGRQTFLMDDFGGAVPIDPSLLFSEFSGSGKKFGQIVFEFSGIGFEQVLGDGSDSYQRQINVVDNVSLLKGSHHFRVGADYRRLTPIYGPFEYSLGVFFCCSEAEVLSGTADTVANRAGQGSRPVFQNLSFYGQDTWKLSRRLTLDMGLRWELNPAPHDANGLKPVTVVGVENLPTATLAPANATFYKTFYGAFAPRIGIAYQLREGLGHETVLRGGFGIYYDLGSGQAAASFTGFPFNVSKFFGFVPFPIPPALAAPLAFPAVTLPITSDLYALDPKLQLPYTLQWNISLEQSLGSRQTISLSYVAAAGRRLLATQSLNWQANGFSGPQPNPNFGHINYTSNGSTSDYHSLQTQYQRRLSRGLQALVSYTWSHAIDDVSNEANSSGLERGNADFDVRHNFTGGVTYDLPRLSVTPVLNMLFRDWSVDSTLYIQSGLPLGLNLSPGGAAIEQPNGRLIRVRPDLIEGMPIWVKDPSVPGGRRINRDAFRRPPANPITPSFLSARQGTLGRNVVRLPGIYQVNLGIQRRFKFSEKWNVQLRAEAFNLFNHPIFGQYVTNVGSSRFGEATAMLNQSLGGFNSPTGLNSLYQLGAPRSMQFSLRLGF